MSRRKKVDYAEKSDSEEFEDFSASEDEWQPQQNEDASEAESDASDADFEEETTSRFGRSSSSKKSRPSSSTSGRRSAAKQKRTISTLRNRMIKKYNPCPRLSNTPAKPISKNITRILEQSQYQRRKSIASSQDGNDSDSSGDDHLVTMNKLDLKSSFFDVDAFSKQSAPENKIPEFDCNAGMKLSDSEDEEDEMEEVKPNKLVIEKEEELDEQNDDEKKKPSRLITGINKNSAGQIDFHQLVKYNIEAQEAEEKLKSITANSIKNEDNLNVSKLLALGEGGSSSVLDVHHSQKAETKGKTTKKRKKATKDGGSESDTDWEQVQDQSQLDTKDVLQINIPLATKSTGEKKKSSQDVEMMIKRKLNRDMKENQIYLHKVSLICHIAHGLYCSRVLNSPTLMAAALKLLPNKSCYPDGTTCIKYFESIAKWYKQAIPIRKNQMYLGTKKRPKMGVSLALQIKYKEALCKKDFVLIFIILLRAMGFPCRLVINLTPISIRPPQEKLHSLSTKVKDEKKAKKSDSTEIKKEKPQLQKKSHKTNEDHDYAVSSKSKDKSKKNDSKVSSRDTAESKKESKSHHHKDNEKQKPESRSSRESAKTREKKDDKSYKSSSKSEREKFVPEAHTAKKRVVEEKNKKDMKTGSHTAETNKMNEISENGPTISKRVRKQPGNKLHEENVNFTAEKKKTRTLTEKLIKQTKSNKQLDANCPKSPPKLVKADLEQVNIDQETAPSLSPKLVENQANAEVSENKYSSEEGSYPKRAKLEEEENAKLVNDAAAAGLLNKLTLPEEPTQPTLTSKLNNRRGRKKKIVEVIDDEPSWAHNKPSNILVTGTESSNDTVKAGESNDVEQQAAASSTKVVVRSPRNTRSKTPTTPKICEPNEVVGFAERNEVEPFKEIKKNTGAKRGRVSPNLKIKLVDPAEKVDTMHFRVPSGRTTRSQAKQKQANDQVIPQLDGEDDSLLSLKKRNKTKSRKAHDSDDDDFVPMPAKKPRPSTSSASKSKSNKDRKVLSSSSEDDDNLKTKKMDIWVEVYSEKEEKWVSINLFKTQVDNPDELRKTATGPVAYVFAWNNDNTLKDVSPRYCPLWNTATRKQRVEKEWLDDAIRDYLERRTRRSKAEDVEFHRLHLDKPLPTAISEYKNHPLYALQRHLLKFEAIYPPDALTLGFIRGEPVYARDCVHTLHSRDVWLRVARVVKPGEKPYKIVKARPKWDRLTQSVITDLPLEIFGKWQTMDYDPPTAENGRVPRNAYGNVDLFQPSMLPKKTVHLELPGLHKVCKKLKIDCAQAVVGFDFHQGACHPIIQGYVVCEEFHDTVVDAWNREQEEAERKEDEKYYQRVYGNWKKLYRGLLIRERLKRKYNFKTLKIDDGTGKSSKKKNI